jgi:hypothetical protein
VGPIAPGEKGAIGINILHKSINEPALSTNPAKRKPNEGLQTANDAHVFTCTTVGRLWNRSGHEPTARC